MTDKVYHIDNTSIKHRLEKDIDNSYDNIIDYNVKTGEYKKIIENPEIIFKINIINNYDKIFDVGSFIRSVCALFIKIKLSYIMIIIDLTSYNDIKYLNIKKIINQITYTSMGLVVFTNCNLILPDILLNNEEYKKQKSEISNCISIVSKDEIKCIFLFLMVMILIGNIFQYYFK